VCRYCGYRFEPAPESAVPADPRGPSRLRRLPWVLAGVALVVIAGGVLAVVLSSSGGKGKKYDTTLRNASEAMEPNAVGAQLEIDEHPGRIGRGDVVIFDPPQGANENRCGIPSEPDDGHPCAKATPSPSTSLFVKRVVAVGGDQVKIIAGDTYIDGKQQAEPFIRPDASCPICNLPKEITIPSDEYFVVGDNRGQSADSREWGPVPAAWIRGKVVGTKR
jgi:signal peptidase I